MKESQGHITGVGGLKLFYRTWTPAQPVGSVVLVHGTNEHVGRYQHVADFFLSQGLAVYALDQRGHGRSEGTRCYVDRFEEYLEDLRQFVSMAQEYGSPIMVGHSLGGLIAYRYGLAFPETISGLIISSPMFRIAVKGPPGAKVMLPLLARFMPKLQVPSGIPVEHLSRDPETGRAYSADPLVWHKATPRWVAVCSKAGEESLSGEADLKVPVLFLQAGEDRLVDPEATRAVYNRVPHERKRFRSYPGAYHEIFNELNKAEVFADILAWMREQELIRTV